jgi:hypothetical protein
MGSSGGFWPMVLDRARGKRLAGVQFPFRNPPGASSGDRQVDSMDDSRKLHILEVDPRTPESGERESWIGEFFRRLLLEIARKPP